FFVHPSNFVLFVTVGSWPLAAYRCFHILSPHSSSTHHCSGIGQLQSHATSMHYSRNAYRRPIQENITISIHTGLPQFVC
ncbi:hypothetical protein, partial [Duganella phyllosphaerae]|uniref:hypothetical protein n=1 Tax=Duganella phyllosphaerae TaxID=762836 RepID=UPI001ABF2F24